MSGLAGAVRCIYLVLFFPLSLWGWLLCMHGLLNYRERRRIVVGGRGGGWARSGKEGLWCDVRGMRLGGLFLCAMVLKTMNTQLGLVI